MSVDDSLVVGLAQMAPVWLDREQTVAKVVEWVGDAAAHACQLVAFGEALCPGYPFWIERTDGARFNSPVQKELHAHYLDQAVQIERGDLDEVRNAAAHPSSLQAIPHQHSHSTIQFPGHPFLLCRHQRSLG